MSSFTTSSQRHKHPESCLAFKFEACVQKTVYQILQSYWQGISVQNWGQLVEALLSSTKLNAYEVCHIQCPSGNPAENANRGTTPFWTGSRHMVRSLLLPQHVLSHILAIASRVVLERQSCFGRNSKLLDLVEASKIRQLDLQRQQAPQKPLGSQRCPMYPSSQRKLYEDGNEIVISCCT